jgi:hypothetical protein
VKEYLNKIEDIPLNKLIYVDESGIDNKCHRKYCWRERGKNIPTNNTGKEYVRTTIIGVLRDGNKEKKEEKKPFSLLSFYGQPPKTSSLLKFFS